MAGSGSVPPPRTHLRSPRAAAGDKQPAADKEVPHVADPSFDVVSKVDRQEVDNALNQAMKEISTRYDFKNTGALLEWKGEEGIEITANAEERALAVLDVFKEKLVKRA